MDSIKTNLDFGVYRHASLKFTSCGNQHAILYHAGRHQFRLVEKWLAQSLASCTKFNTAAHHIQKAKETLKLSDEQTQRLITEWPGLVREGYLVSLHELLMTMAGKSTSADVAESIDFLGVPTRNRPACVGRLLRDLADQEGNSSIIISDDSDDSGLAGQVQNLVRKYSSDHLPVVYFGQAEKKRFIERLSRESKVSASILEFAVSTAGRGEFSGGANRNALMLFLAGKKFLSIDDDVFCRGREHPKKEEELRVCSINDPTEFFFFENSDLPEFRAYSGLESLRKIHESFLGCSIHQLVAEYAQKSKVDLSRTSPAFLDRMVRQGGDVAITMMGVAGDCAMASNHYYLFLEGVSRERLLASRDLYERYKINRNVIRTVSGPSITDGAFLMTTALGFDGRDILPPFFPVFRNEDMAFGVTLKTLFPNKFIAYVPYGIEHRPLTETKFDSKAISGVPSRAASSWILTESIRSCFSGQDVSNEDRMNLMAEHLINLGNLSVPKLTELLLPKFIAMQAEHVQRLERFLDVYGGKPDYWADDVKKSILQARDSLRRENILLPMDLNGRFSFEEEALSFMQALIKKYGILLSEWPEIYSSARKLNEEKSAVSPQ